MIKVEHVSRGDAMRGLASTGVIPIVGKVQALMEHSNRAKKSIGLDLLSEEGLEIPYQLVAAADIFLTNKLPSVRTKLKIGVEEVRAHNPRIIYVRGTGQGERGPDADKGSYDSLAFWARSGVAVALTRPEYGHVVPLPGPGFGDSIVAMTIAGGMMGALFYRERTGEATVVEVAHEPQVVANGYVQECQTATGTPFWLTSAPVQFDEEPSVPQRAPEFNEHGDAILADLGLDWDRIVDLKVRGVVA